MSAFIRQLLQKETFRSGQWQGESVPMNDGIIQVHRTISQKNGHITLQFRPIKAAQNCLNPQKQFLILFWMLRGYIGGLVVVALQLLLSMIIRSFAVPVLIALGGGIVGMLFVSKGMGLYWPYALMILGMNANKTEDMISKGLMPFFASCCIYCIIIFFTANLLLTKRDIRT